MDKFILHSEYAPTGDQSQAIADLVEGFKQGRFMGSSRSSSPRTQWSTLYPSIEKVVL